jgi:cysteine desulfurase
MAQAAYLDYNATAPLRPQAAAAIADLLDGPHNPSSVHGFGQSARLVAETARRQIAGFLGADPAEIIFVSGGTEANNMALSGWQKLAISAVEHEAVRAARPDAHILPVDADGLVLLDGLADFLNQLSPSMRPDTLVSVMAANNETGVIQPLDEICRLSAEAGVAVHSDMIQLAGRAALDLASSGLSLASFSAHKLGGPTGIGALWVRGGRLPDPMGPLIRGGGQEQGRRSGTENLLGIAGFGAAALAAADGLAQVVDWQQWRDSTIERIATACPQTVLMGGGAARLANTICLGFPGWSSETAVIALDLAGFAVSAGAACSSGKMRPSHVLQAMGQTELADKSLRISFGWDSRAEELEKLADRLIDLYSKKSP